jgi:ABC-type branched-subunit amino acid transport system substrate-binding protein
LGSPSRPRAKAALGLVLALALGAASCSLTRSSVDSCRTNADCRAAFGAAQICGEGGLCQPADPSPRCTSTFPVDLLTRPESYPNAFIVGALMDRSVETQGAREDAIRLAATQVNEERGLDGRLFGVVFCDIAENAEYDSAKRTDAAVASARHLVEVLGVPAIVGPSSSADALAVFDAVEASGALVISPSATSPALTGYHVKEPTADNPGRLWRTAVPDTLQGTAIVQYVRESFSTVRELALVQERGAYGDALGEVVKAGFETEGRVVRTYSYETSSQRDLAIVEGGADPATVVLFVSSQTSDAIGFLNAANSLRSYDTKTLFLTDSAANRDLLTGAVGARDLFPRVVGSRPAVPEGPVFELFRTSFSAAFQRDPSAFSFVPHAYDAAWLVFYGIAWAQQQDGAVSGSGIARGLRQVSAPGEAMAVSPANWGRVVEAFAAGSPVNVRGASGELDFDPVTEQTSGRISIWRIADDGSEIESITTLDPP